MRTRSRSLAAAAPLAAWGERPASARAPEHVYEAVFLVRELQESLLDSVGLLGIGLGGINRSWRAAVKGRRTMWAVLEREPAKDLGSEGTAPGQLKGPFDVAALPEGALCVADSVNHRLHIFSKARGAAPRFIGGSGKQPGQFQYPFGVACDGTSLYVADTFSNRVQKLRLVDGAHLGSVGKADCTYGDGEGQFNYPVGMCVAAGALYVCDTLNSRVVVLGTDLSWRYTIGRRGGGDGEFDGPVGIVAHGGELYVVDQGNHRVQAQRPRLAAPRPARHAPPRLPRQVFAPDPRPGQQGRMRFARAFGGEGAAPGQFEGPWGVAVVRGLLVVSDFSSCRASRRVGRLQVLTTQGVPLQALLTFGESCFRGLCAHEQRMWASAGHTTGHVRALKIL
jgi:hypothetical protein